MKLLLLGGPRFLGRAVAAASLERGHELTFFNRGRTNPDLYPEVERLIGDRGEDLELLRARSWDAVVDTCGYVPGVVRASAEALVSSGLYCCVSSVSVYADFSAPVDESSPLAELGDLPADQVTDESYGPLKALCEKAVLDVFDERALVVRPGLIVGPHDPTGRFTYWPHRVARGGEVLAPASPDAPTQFVDVRDLGDWIVSLCEHGTGGIYNATHPGCSWSELLDTCRKISGSNAEITWVAPDFLVDRDVGQWMELPLWLHDPKLAYAHRVDVQRALDAGLTFRPLEETVRGALEEAETTDAAGLTPERESGLLEAWHGREQGLLGHAALAEARRQTGRRRRRVLHDHPRGAGGTLRSPESDPRPCRRPLDRVAEEGGEDPRRPELRRRAGDRARAWPRRQQELLDRRALAGAALRLPAH